MESMNTIIEEVLSQNAVALGKDIDTYRNHVYRIFTICLYMDDALQNKDKYAIASVFHDLGIWTNSTFDYLNPSIDLAQKYLKRNDKSDWYEEIKLMIRMHHKLSKYSGAYEKSVEVFRKSDWIDVTKGIKLFGFSKQKFSKISDQFPSLSFHKFLINQTIKNLFMNPLNPLPMFRR